MAARPALREQYELYLRKSRRSTRISNLIIVAAFACALVVAYLTLYNALVTEVPTRAELSRHQLSDVFVDLYIEIESLRENLTATIVRDFVLFFGLPLMLLVLLLILVHQQLSDYASRRIFNTPALVEQLLVYWKAGLATQRVWWVASSLLLFGLGGGAMMAMPKLAALAADPAALARAMLLIGLAWILVAALLWTAAASRRRVASLVSPSFARRTALDGVVAIGLASCALVLLVAGSNLIASALSTRLHTRLADVYSEIPSSVTAADFREGMSSDECDLIVASIDSLYSLLQRVDEAGSAVGGLINELVTLENVSCVFFCFCFVLYIITGPTVLQTEYRRPWLALVAIPVGAVVIERASDVFLSLYDQMGWFQYVAKVAVIAAAFTLGQMSGIYLKRVLEGGQSCPRCSFPIHETDQVCRSCGTRVGLLSMGELVGNAVSRELHIASCQHLRRLSDDKKRKFKRPEEAYWDGFDNCGTCLGGSGYRVE